MRASRAEWRRRVRRWAKSGQTAAEFATSAGINANTLKYWKCILGRQKAGAVEHVPGKREQVGTRNLPWPLVEVRSAHVADGRIELELPRGRRLRVPAQFDLEDLQRLLSVLDPEPAR